MARRPGRIGGTSGAEGKSSRISRVAERRRVKRNSRKKDRQTETAKVVQSVQETQSRHGNERRNDEPVDKWRKRDVTTQEARRRFDTLLQEFKNGQKPPDQVVLDTDDLDNPVPEDVVQGEFSFFG